MSEANTLAVIPARGESKGLPRKNVLPLAGKPLIAWSVSAAQNAGVLDRIIVSTDDEEIAAAARTAGAEVPFLRPASIAGDESTVEEVIDHALNFFKREERTEYEHIILLQPTSPMRTGEHIREALALYDGTRPVVSVCRAPAKSAWLMRRNPDKSVQFCFGPAESVARRRQDLPELFYPNGSIYIAPAALARSTGFFSETTIPFVMPEEHAIDIDTLGDLRRAEIALSS